ncbi:MAG: hypothetical protein ACOX6J_05655 [Oscillospiraceae bacterium]|jgi:hypothetical protein
MEKKERPPRRYLSISFDEEHYRDLMRKSELTGFKPTELVRVLIMGYEPREKPGPEFYEALDRACAAADELKKASKTDSGEELPELSKKFKDTIKSLEEKFLMPPERRMPWR